MVRKSNRLQTPVRKKGDPTGQSKAIDEQIAAVEGEVESTGGMPNVGPMPQPQQPQPLFAPDTKYPSESGNQLGFNEPVLTQANDIKTLKEVILREFPELANRF